MLPHFAHGSNTPANAGHGGFSPCVAKAITGWHLLCVVNQKRIPGAHVMQFH